MDIEGAVPALAGGDRVLSEARPTWLIELQGPECEQGVRRIPSAHGYRFEHLDGRGVTVGELLASHVLAKCG